ncbi:GntR family transcriptional regulator [Sunxiuqinia sp. sy24]|uniref:GntR family transcriptional regulator n=1 Tax=Sunxiuqinia sp. sy24 TaxID=3461495 RepID=UPI0040457B26
MTQFSRIDSDSEVPKYKQVEDLILSDIETGIFKHGQRIPSINETSEELLLSRDTVEKAYVRLREKGVLSAVRGKGYYVNRTTVGKKLKIALIFNKLSNYKRSLYASFVSTVGSKASVDVFIYNYDLAEFENILNGNLTNYDYFVILPHFRNEHADISAVVKKIPKEKILIIDKNLEELHDYPVVYQEYDKDIQQALGQALDLLKKYKRLNLVFPSNEYYSNYINRGFQIFNQMHGFEYQILNSLKEEDIRQHEAFILISDNDLYDLIKQVKLKKWIPGKDIGILSYNESPVKELLCDGISTISTNHDQIGQMAAEMILTNDFKRVKSPFEFIRRNSL